MDKKFKRIRKLLIGALVATILLTIIYFLVFLVMLFVYGFAAVVAAIIVAIFGGQEEVTMDPTGQLIVSLFFVLSVISAAMIIPNIVVLVLSRKLDVQKTRVAVSVMSIVANVPTIIIPVGLIAGIFGLTYKEEEPVSQPVPETPVE